MCRKHEGSLFHVSVGVPAAQFRYLSGEELVQVYASSSTGRRAFCRACGSTMPSKYKDDVILVPAGTLDEDPGVRPQAHIFVGSKFRHHEIKDELPQFEAFPPGETHPVTARPARTPPFGMTSGSCLCGRIAFEIQGAPRRMVNCHCSRCRKTRGSAHATNVFMRSEGFEWTTGEERVADYRMPGARMYRNSFCKECGSKLPSLFAEIASYLIPVGSLDSDPGIAPGVNVYIDSKAPWFEIRDDLPRFAGMPPREEIPRYFF
jgi:hypothetical protein